MGLEMIYTFCLALGIATIGLFILWPAAREYGLLDSPDERKQHQGKVPLIGGICIFLGVWSTLLIPGIDNPSYFFIYLVILLVMGVADDYLGLSIGLRIGIQLLVALAVCQADNHLITYTGNVIGLGGIGTGILAFPLTVIAIVAAINAFNMIDGIDGLAASLALVSFGSLALLFYNNDLLESLIICIAFIGSLIPYLLANLTIKPFKVKVFLGDAGSIIIGFSIVWLLIEGSQPADRAHPESRAFFPATAMWIVGLPLFDLMSVSLRRMFKGKSPLSGDRSHIHHVIMKYGINRQKCLLICIALALALSVTGIIFDSTKLETASFLSFWLIFIAYHLILTNLSNKQVLT